MSCLLIIINRGASEQIKLDMGSVVEEPSGVQEQNSCCGGWGQNPRFFYKSTIVEQSRT